MIETSDKLIRSLNKGDSRALRTILEMHYRNLRTFARCFINDIEIAESIVLDKFELLWRLRKRFSQIADVKAFLYLHTKNSCLSLLRNRKQQLEMEQKNSEKFDEHSLIKAELIGLILKSNNQENFNNPDAVGPEK